MTAKRIRGLGLALCLFALACAGNRQAGVGPLLPLLPHPASPRLENVSVSDLEQVGAETRARLLSRDAALRDALRRYHDTVETYNRWARQENAKNGYERRERP